MGRAVNTATAEVFAWVDERMEDLSSWSATIWDFAEPALREYRSAAWYVDRLEREGFAVEAGSGGMPTAFRAEWSNGAGPRILAYAEYDAVPGNCRRQRRASSRGPACRLMPPVTPTPIRRWAFHRSQALSPPRR